LISFEVITGVVSIVSGSCGLRCHIVDASGLLLRIQQKHYVSRRSSCCVWQKSRDSMCSMHHPVRLRHVRYILNYYWRPAWSMWVHKGLERIRAHDFDVLSVPQRRFLSIAKCFDLPIIVMPSDVCLWLLAPQFSLRIAVFVFVYGNDYCKHWYMSREFTMSVSSVAIILPLCFPKRIDFLKYTRYVFLGKAAACKADDSSLVIAFCCHALRFSAF